MGMGAVQVRLGGDLVRGPLKKKSSNFNLA